MNFLIDLFRYFSLLIAILFIAGIYASRLPKGKARNWNNGRYSKTEVSKKSQGWYRDGGIIYE